MAVTANKSLPLVDPTDPPNGPSQIDALAQALDILLGRTSYAQAAGSNSGYTGTLASGVGSGVNLPLPAGRFTHPPIITATLQNAPSGSGTLTARAINITNTTFDLYLYNAGGSSATYTGVTIVWSAVQMLPATSAG